jgi:hypothetical protein
VLGPLANETKTRFVYCLRRGQIAFVPSALAAHPPRAVQVLPGPSGVALRPSAASSRYDRRLAKEGDVVLGRDAVVAAVERDHGQGRVERNRYFL